MPYTSIKKLRADLKAGDLYNIAIQPTVRVRGVITDGVLHTREPRPGYAGMGPYLDGTVPLSTLLDGTARRCESGAAGAAEACTARCGHDKLMFDKASQALEALVAANSRVVDAERHIESLPGLHNRATSAAAALSLLHGGAWYLNNVTDEQVEQAGLTGTRDSIVERHRAATQTWQDVASGADTRNETLELIRTKLGGPHPEHFPVSDHDAREVLIGLPDPLKFDTLVKSLTECSSVVPANDDTRNAVVRAPAYVRDYALTFEEVSYADVQIVDDPEAAADSALLEMAVTLWDPTSDTPLANLAHAVSAVRNARA